MPKETSRLQKNSRAKTSQQPQEELQSPPIQDLLSAGNLLSFPTASTLPSPFSFLSRPGVPERSYPQSTAMPYNIFPPYYLQNMIQDLLSKPVVPSTSASTAPEVATIASLASPAASELVVLSRAVTPEIEILPSHTPIDSPPRAASNEIPVGPALAVINIDALLASKRNRFQHDNGNKGPSSSPPPKLFSSFPTLSSLAANSAPSIPANLPTSDSKFQLPPAFKPVYPSQVVQHNPPPVYKPTPMNKPPPVKTTAEYWHEHYNAVAAKMQSAENWVKILTEEKEKIISIQETIVKNNSELLLQLAHRDDVGRDYRKKIAEQDQEIRRLNGVIYELMQKQQIPQEPQVAEEGEAVPMTIEE